jgi:hypothetical protein
LLVGFEKVGLTHPSSSALATNNRHFLKLSITKELSLKAYVHNKKVLSNILLLFAAAATNQPE